MENNDTKNDGKTCCGGAEPKCCCMTMGKKLCAAGGCIKVFLLKLFGRR